MASPSLTPEVIAQLKATHGELRKYTVDPFEFVCKPPDVATYKRFRQQIFEEGKRPHAPGNMFHGCVVWPEGEELKAALEKRPGAVESIASDLVAWAGFTDAVEKKEL